MTTSAYNAGVNARAKVNAKAAAAGQRTAETAKYWGGCAKFAAQSTAGFVRGFFARKTELTVEQPSVTLTEAQLNEIVEAEINRRVNDKAIALVPKDDAPKAKARKPRAAKPVTRPIEPTSAAAKRALAKTSK